MTQKQLIIKLAMIVSTLGETTEPGQSVPASTPYLALGSNLAEYTALARMGEHMGWLKTTPETVKLTPAGRRTAKSFQEIGV